MNLGSRTFRISIVAIVAIAAVGSLSLYFGSRSPRRKSASLFRPRPVRLPRTLPPVLTRAWTPPSVRPTPKERLTGAPWKNRLEAALKGRSQAERDMKVPAFGLQVIEVFTGGQAEQLGVKIGDRLLRFNGKPILGSEAYQIARAMAPGKLEVWSSGLREIELKEGSFGANWKAVWQSESAYLQSTDRDARWDDFVLAACLAWVKDEEVAETALFHAQAAGYRGWITPAVMTRLCHENGRHAEAMDFGWAAGDETPAEGLGPVLQAMHRSAFLLGHLDRARSISESRPDHPMTPLGWDYSPAEARHRNVKRGPEAEPTPCVLATEGRFPAGPMRGLELNGECVERDFARGSPNLFSFEAGGAIVFLGPPARNPAFSVDIEIAGTPGRAAAQLCTGRFHLVDVASGADEILASLELRPEVGIGVAASGIPQVWLSGNSLLPSGANTIDLALNGPWCEIRVNGRCVLLALVPEASGREVALAFELWNVTGRFLCIERRDLKGRETDPVPPLRAPGRPDGLRVPPVPSDPVSAWYHGALVESYLRSGSRSASWDDAALAALAAAVPYLKNRSHRTDLHLVREKARQAFQAGCDDPVVLFVLDRAHEDLEGSRDWDITRRFRRSLGRLRESISPAALQALLLLHSISDWYRGRGLRNPQGAYRTAEEVLTLLPKAVSEKGVPPRVLVGIMRDLMNVLPEARTDSWATFQRVWTAAEAGRAGSAAGLAFKGYFHIDHAWEARGSDWARNVSEEGWKRFGERLATAAQAFEAAWRLEPQDPAAPAGMLTVALGHEEARRNLATWWERSLAADSNYTDAGDRVLHAMMPRWLGSEKALLGFGRECFNRCTKQELQPCMAMLLLEAHEKLLIPNSLPARTPVEERWFSRQYWTLPAVWKDVQEVFSWILKNYPETVYYRSRYAYFAARCGRWQEADEQFQLLGDSVAWAAAGGREEGTLLRALARNRRR